MGAAFSPQKTDVLISAVQGRNIRHANEIPVTMLSVHNDAHFFLYDEGQSYTE